MLARAFFEQPTLELAHDLLGKVLVRRLGDQLLSGRIVEVEAYHQDGDEAAHSFRGRTPRNAAMFAAPGILYVYRCYGMHWCCNIVSEAEGIGAAVLLRALEPLTGQATMAKQRAKPGEPEPARFDLLGLANGPGKLCQALAIDKSHDGASLLGPELWLQEGPRPESIQSSTRIGISKSREREWRFHLAGNPFVSRKKP